MDGSPLSTIRRRRSTKVLRGGKFIGQGSYGCVFSPAVPTMALVGDPSKAVGKMFVDRESAAVEMKYSTLLASIDADQQHFVYATEQVDVQTLVLKSREREDFIKCDLFTQRTVDRKRVVTEKPPPHTLVQTVMPGLGYRSLETYLTEVYPSGTMMSVSTFIAMIEPVVAGVAKLIDHELIHQDIKTDNIVVTLSGTARLIDFGLMTTFKTFLTPLEDDLFSRKYYVNPPEYRLFSDNMKTILSFRDSVSDLNTGTKTWTSVAETFEPNPDIVQTVEMMRGSHVVDEIRRQRGVGPEAPPSKPSEIHRTLLERIPTIPALSDIYSLGLVFVRCRKVLNPEENPYVLQVFNKLVEGMTFPNPERRWDIKRVIAGIEQIKEAIDNSMLGGRKLRERTGRRNQVHRF